MLLVVAFFFTLDALNISLLFFSLFVLFGAFGKSADNEYVKLYSEISENRLKRGMTVKIQAVDKGVTVKKVMSMLDEYSLNEIQVYDGEEKIYTLSQRQINNIIISADFYQPISKYVK